MVATWKCFICLEWRNEEMALIDELYSGPERKAALVGLLEQEAYLISSIDRHKLVADEENKDKRIKNFLNKVCGSVSVDPYCYHYIQAGDLVFCRSSWNLFEQK